MGGHGPFRGRDAPLALIPFIMTAEEKTNVSDWAYSALSN